MCVLAVGGGGYYYYQRRRAAAGGGSSSSSSGGGGGGGSNTANRALPLGGGEGDRVSMSSASASAAVDTRSAVDTGSSWDMHAPEFHYSASAPAATSPAAPRPVGGAHI